MKRLFTILLTLLAAPAFAQRSVPEIPFESAPDYFQYPAEMNLGEMASVAVNSKGHVFMLSRSNTTGPVYGSIATQVLEFDEKGAYVREIGKGVYGFGYGHSIRVDKEDNIWVVDKGTNMIMKFNPLGHVTMTLGRKEEATDEHKYLGLMDLYTGKVPPPIHQEGIFRQPTDIAWDAAGNIYISDGYVNSRAVKISKDGDWIKDWVSWGTETGQFRSPHNIGTDRAGNVYVADRGNARIQVFDGDGKFLRFIKLNVSAPPGTRDPIGTAGAVPATMNGTYAPGAPNAICITQGATQYLYILDIFPGRIYKLTLDGKILGMLGGPGRQLKQFNHAHGLACPSENELYVADLNNWRVQKLILHPALD